MIDGVRLGHYNSNVLDRIAAHLNIKTDDLIRPTIPEHLSTSHTEAEQSTQVLQESVTVRVGTSIRVSISFLQPHNINQE